MGSDPSHTAHINATHFASITLMQLYLHSLQVSGTLVVERTSNEKGGKVMSASEELRERLTEMAPSLGRAQRQVARVMLEDMAAMAYMPAADLAVRAGVHVATVVRLAQRLGFEGYPHLQRSLRTALSQYPRFLKNIGQEGASHGSNAASALVESVFSRAHLSLDQLTRDIRTEMLSRMAQGLAEARQVLVFGIGIADPVASHIASSLRVLGVSVSRPVDPVTAIHQLATMNGDDIVFVIDFKRYYRESVRVAKTAVRTGAAVMVLTDSEVSPLAQFASHTLIAPSDSPAPRTSLVPAFAVAEALIAVTAVENRAKAKQSMGNIDRFFEEGEVLLPE